jgi:subtilisin family serine protease
MKHNYLFLRRTLLTIAFAVWLLTLSVNLAMAQQRPELDAGVIRIKVTEQLAQQLETARFSRTPNNDLVTGISALDAVNIRYRANAIKRVFRDAGKYEAKHKRHGLHLWYEIQVDKAAPILNALNDYKSLQNIQRAEPSYKKAIIGSENPDFGPRIVRPEDVTPPTLPGASNDPLLSSQWHYENTGQAGGTPGSDISLFQAWGLTTGTPNVIIGVTDGGAQVDHPDLAANMWVNTDEIPGNNLDDDNNGFIDDINGYGFGDDTGEIAPDDHGTHTSGTIAAVTHNGIGVAGVAGGSGTGDGARIMTLAAFGGTGTGGFAETYVYAADNGAVISQNSWGYTFPDVFEQAVLDAIDYFIAEAGKDELGNQVGPMNGGIVIFAAGNSNTDDEWYPGFYESTLAVAGLTNQDKKAWYSNFGTWVDISAPGGETFVANDPHGVLSTIANNNYAFFQGTSMACPHVSGVAALIISKFGGPGFTPAMLRGRLVTLVDNVDAADPPFAGLLGSGRVNAFAALQEDDGDAPVAINDLDALDASITTVTLTWTSPSDPGNGSASVYDIRYSTSPITEANFDSATPVTDLPEPKPAGTPDTLTVSGLAPGTTYYFAIKSADFFGNYSAISNVVEQATNFPPVLGVSPASFTVNLQTAASTTRTVNISNTGMGVLTFQLLSLGPDGFSTPDFSEGSVNAGETLELDVAVSASNLFPGTYEQTWLVQSNDPVNDSVTFTITLNVTSNGQPIASVNPSALDFGEVFQTGSKIKTFEVHNAGAEPLLITSVLSNNPDFTTDFPDTLTVTPFADTTITVTYTASSLGVSSGIISISTNDPDHATLTVAVTGEGVIAPDIAVSPSSLSASLNTGNTTTQTLTISNSGGSDLNYAIEIAAETPVTVTATKTLNVPSKNTSASSVGNQKTKGSSTKQYGNQVRIPSVGQTALATKILILTPDSDVTDIETILDSFDSVQADVFPNADLPGIALADLEGYDIVFTTNNTQWLQAGGVEPEAVGDLLADYVDAGGKVIVNQFAYSYDAWQMTGRFFDEDYGPFTRSTTDANIDTELGDILSEGHPLLEGVSAISYSGYVQDVGLAPGAVAVAEWANGELFLAANANVVGLNFLPSLGNGGALQWEGDVPAIYLNSIRYLSGPSFVSVDPSSGVVAPGSSVDLTVTFDASGLDSGVYNATINVLNNAPNEELVAVPASLTVLGPEFTVNPTSLSEALPKNATSTQTLTLSNNGPEDATYSISVQGGLLGTATVSVKPDKSSARKTTEVRANKDKQKAASSNARVNFTGKELAISREGKSKSSARGGVERLSTALYGTDFEEFAPGDIDGQNGWLGQWGNWTIEGENPSSGSQHFRGLADGFGFSLALSPLVEIGSSPKSTTTMKVNLNGSGVTWQVVPESPTATFVNTRIQFNPDGTASALVDDGAGGAVFAPIGTTPSGYFDLTIEVDRASAEFDVYFNDDKVFTGQGFAGDIEEVVILSLMEVAGPTMDVDDLQIIDGTNDNGPSFISASPTSGNLPSGSSVEITVTFNSADLEFGTYASALKIDIGGESLIVPASLRVFGDPNISVNPTVLQTTVDYKGRDTTSFTIANTGGNPLNYSLQVIGAGVDLTKLPPSPVSKNSASDPRRIEKKKKDDAASKVILKKTPSVELYAGTSLLEQNFEGGTFPPSGWSVIDNAGSGVAWDFAAAYGDGNYSGTGEAATVDSDAAGSAEFDTELISPAIDVTAYKNVVVQYNVNYQNYAGLDFLDLDISVDGGAWQNVLSWNEDHGSLFAAPGEFVSAPLGTFLSGATSFRLRWHYYDPNTGDWDWYAQVDDITVLGDAKTWLAVSPAAGTIPVGESAVIDAEFDATDNEPGFYVAGILVSSNAPANPLVGVVASMTVREPADIDVSVSSLYQELNAGEQATQTFTIANNGESVLKYGFGNTPVPAEVPVSPPKARITTEGRTERYAGPLSNGKQAISSSVGKKAATPLYVTGFEDFATGNINGQNGWAGQYGNWTVEDDNAYEGTLHFRGLSDGLGQSLAFSPEVAIGTEPISSTAFQLNVVEGVTWEVIPQSPTAQFVNTRFRIAPNGSLSALVDDGADGVYAPIAGTLPEGYFEFRIDVDRASKVFTIYVDGAELFTGQGFAGDIEQVVLFSLMEAAGQTFDIDNFAIYDGAGFAPWLTYNPKSGYILPGEEATITVGFNAADLPGGSYYDTLKISSNDPVTPHVAIPVQLEVNALPVIDSIAPVSVVETGSLNVTFTASDPEGSNVSVVLQENLAFITPVSSGNGTATYSIKPKFGDAGSYALSVVATDADGATATETFNLTVVPYGVQDFSLIVTATNQTITTFSDTVVVDVTDPAFTTYTIRANTNPATVGSVRFWVDGQFVNNENDATYILSPSKLGQLSGGYHTILARSYTKASGGGVQGKSHTAVIHIINSASVTDFDVVKHPNTKLMDLSDSAVVDISQAAYKQINVRANTAGTTKSVVFRLNGSVFRYDNAAPYQLNGVNGSNDLAWPVTPGWYTVTATPYSKFNGQGVAGTPLTVTFRVVNGAAATARAYSAEEAVDGETNTIFTLAPVPTADRVTIHVKEQVKGNVGVFITSSTGKQMFTTNGDADKFRNYTISTNDLGMAPGLYLVQVKTADGRVEMKRVVKE